MCNSLCRMHHFLLPCQPAVPRVRSTERSISKSSRSSLRNTNDPVSALIKTISHTRTPKDQIVWRVSFQRSQRFPCQARKASGYICLSIPLFYHPQASFHTHQILDHRAPVSSRNPTFDKQFGCFRHVSVLPIASRKHNLYS